MQRPEPRRERLLLTMGGLATSVDVRDAPRDRHGRIVFPFEAPTLAETDVGGGPSAETMIRRISRLMRPANYLGTPALAFPAGFSAERLPVGLQLVGRPFAEDVLFALVGAFQRATDFHRQDPLA